MPHKERCSFLWQRNAEDVPQNKHSPQQILFFRPKGNFPSSRHLTHIILLCQVLMLLYKNNMLMSISILSKKSNIIELLIELYD